MSTYVRRGRGRGRREGGRGGGGNREGGERGEREGEGVGWEDRGGVGWEERGGGSVGEGEEGGVEGEREGEGRGMEGEGDGRGGRGRHWLDPVQLTMLLVQRLPRTCCWCKGPALNCTQGACVHMHTHISESPSVHKQGSRVPLHQTHCTSVGFCPNHSLNSQERGTLADATSWANHRGP